MTDDKYSRDVAAWRLEVQQTNAARATAEVPTATIVGVIEARTELADPVVGHGSARTVLPGQVVTYQEVDPVRSADDARREFSKNFKCRTAAMGALLRGATEDITPTPDPLPGTPIAVDPLETALACIRSLLAHHKRNGYAKPEEQQAWQDAERLVGR